MAAKVELKIDPTFKVCIPVPRAEELVQLEANLVAEGCRDALVVWQGFIADGHNRYEICTRLGISFKTVELKLTSRPEVKLWIVLNQAGRRNLTIAQKAKLGLALLEYEQELAAQRQKEGQRSGGEYGALGGRPKAGEKPLSDSSRTRVSDEDVADRSSSPASPAKVRGSKGKKALEEPKPPKESKSRASDRAGSKFGVSGKTVERLEYIEANADAETIAKVAAGDLDIKPVYDKLRAAEKRRKREEAKVAQAENASETAVVYRCDCLEYMWLMPERSVDLLLTDPPYSTDVKDIVAFAREWVPLACKLVKPTGRAYVCTGSYPAELVAYLDVLHTEDLGDLELDDVLVWTWRNTMGPSRKRGYKRNWSAIFYLVGKEAPPLDCPELNEHFSVQDINAPDGRLGGRYHAWQKPDELAERFVRHATQAGDTVFDPFAGTGTFVLAAASLGRHGVGCELDKVVAKIAAERGCQCVKK